MAKKTYYKWIGTNGKECWWSSGIHKYLLQGELQRAYMRQSKYLGVAKRFTAHEMSALRGNTITKEV